MFVTFVDQDIQEKVNRSITQREIMRRLSTILVIFVIKDFTKNQTIKIISTNTQGPRNILAMNVEKVFHILAILTDIKESTLMKSLMCAKIVGKDLIKQAH